MSDTTPSPTPDRALAERLARLSPEKRALLLARLKAGKGKAGGGAETERARPEPGEVPRAAPKAGAIPLAAAERAADPGPAGELAFPVSFSQLREWILDRLTPGTAAYNIPTTLALAGELSHRALAAAARGITRRHEALRTTFIPPAPPRGGGGPTGLAGEFPGEPLQLIAPELALPLPLVDLGGLAAEDRRREAGALADREAGRPFDLARGPLVRLALLRLEPELHWLLLTFHHIISDGWSMGIFSRELAALYAAELGGGPAGLPALPIGYPDFAVWQRRTLRGETLARHLDFWRRRLMPLPPPADLPTDRPRPPVRGSRGGKVVVRWPAELRNRLHEVAQAGGASLFMLFLAALGGLVRRLTGNSDLALGTYIANRNRRETRDLIGFFINTLVLRMDLSGDPSFRTLLARVREETLDAYAHQDLPFEKLLDALDVPRDQSRTPLFQVHCVLQNLPIGEVHLPGLTLSPVAPHRQSADFDLTLWLSEGPTFLHANFEYSADLFDLTTIHRLAGQLRHLLEGVAAAPERSLSDLPVLGPAERHQLLGELDSAGGTTPGSRPHPLVHQAFAAAARKGPEAVALVVPGGEGGEERLSYGELHRRALALAGRLVASGVGTETAVALPAGRGAGHLVALLGILGAGASYLPLDPTHPEERLETLLADARPALLFVPGECSPTLAAAADRAGVRVLDGEPRVERGPAARGGEWPGDRRLDPLNRAYTLYTSGSTGRPKGVEISHGALAHYTATAIRRFGIGPGDRVLQFASLTFDTSAEEIFPTLARGATLLAREDVLPPPAPFTRRMVEQATTVLDLPTAWWHALMGAGSDLPLPAALRLVILGGEAAAGEAVAAWRRRGPAGVELVNTYGPTEATIIVTAETLAGPGAGERSEREPPRVAIGRPRAGVRVRVLDQRLRPVPLGVPGEAALGGPCLARGYLRRPGTTAAVFVPDPFPGPGEEGERLYRSGDRVRRLPDGRLTFLGRLDHQVKVRGIRVELGEIEAALRAHPALAEAVVLPRQRPGEAALTLVAYAVPRKQADAAHPASAAPAPAAPAPAALTAVDLRAWLGERLPAAAVPAAVLLLDALPLTARGKIDRARLPEPGDGASPAGGVPYVPPGGEVERTLARLWGDVLGIERVGRDDNFFELGGDSLRLLTVHEKIRERFGADLPVLDLFRYPTVRALAGRLGEGGETGRPSVAEVQQKVTEQRRLAKGRRERLRGLQGPGRGPGRKPAPGGSRTGT